MKEYEVDAYLLIKDEEAFERELGFKEGEEYKVTKAINDGSNTGSGVYVIDGRGGETFVDLMDLTILEVRDYGALRTELFCVDSLVKGDKVLILQKRKMEEGEQFSVGEVVRVSLVGSDGTVYLESAYEEFVPVRNYERGYITKVHEITKKKEGGEDMVKIFEAGDIIKVLKPESIIAGYDLTEGREYTVVREYSEEGCYIIDDNGDSLYLTRYEIEDYCEIIKKEEVREPVTKDFVHPRIRAEEVKKIKVLNPKRIVWGYDLTEGKEYNVVGKFTTSGCHIVDDVGDTLYLLSHEIEDYCEIVREEKDEVITEEKEKRGSMLEVKVVKDENKTVEDKWKAGNILSNEDGSTLIMLIKPDYTNEDKLEVLVLKYNFSTKRMYSIDKSRKSYWLEKCPILVSKSELNIEI